MSVPHCLVPQERFYIEDHNPANIQATVSNYFSANVYPNCITLCPFHDEDSFLDVSDDVAIFLAVYENLILNCGALLGTYCCDLEIFRYVGYVDVL